MSISAQFSVARHLLSSSRTDIAAATRLLQPTTKRAEIDRSVPVSDNAVRSIQAALEAAGVEFIAENGNGTGVRLRGDVRDV